MKTEYFRIALSNITKKGIRSWLTMIGIFIGIAAVVSLISLGQGLKDAIDTQFASMGTDIILVMPGSGFESFGSSKLTRHDEDLIRSVNGVDNAAPFIVKLSKITFQKEVAYTIVIGTPTDSRFDVIEGMSTFKTIEGRNRFYPTDKHSVAVGYTLAHGDFLKHKNVKLNDNIRIDDTEFKVVGIMDKVGNPEDDKNVYIPLDTAEELFKDKDYNQLIVKARQGADISKVAEDIKAKMRKDRNQKEGEEDFMVQTSEQLLESVGGILNTVQAFLVGIALISLMVGGIGIMNTMYTSVLERTREIGVMKAIGARNSDIRWLFLIEAGVLGTVGGAIGIVMGLAMSKSVEYVGQAVLGNDLLRANTSWQLIFGALAFSFVVGSLSGVLPAGQASKLKPVEALRYE
ncbi:MAG: ABC transporter permease [Candidatus Altiarchaeota archaeon]